jgi:hypothetical protein
MRKRYALDASVLASIVNSDDVEHFSCYSFFRNHDDNDEVWWVVPGLVFFEFQATQSTRYRTRLPGEPVFRNAPLHYENAELYHVTKKFLAKVYELDLYERFSRLRGADLLYACIACVEGIPGHEHKGSEIGVERNSKRLDPNEEVQHATARISGGDDGFVAPGPGRLRRGFEDIRF